MDSGNHRNSRRSHSHHSNNQRANNDRRDQHPANDQSYDEQPNGAYLPTGYPQSYQGAPEPHRPSNHNGSRSRQPPHSHQNPRDDGQRATEHVAQYDSQYRSQYHSQHSAPHSGPYASSYTAQYANNGNSQGTIAIAQRTNDRYTQHNTPQAAYGTAHWQQGGRNSQSTVTAYGGRNAQSTMPAYGYEQPNNWQAPPIAAPSNATPAPGLKIEWTGPAEEQLARMTPAQCDGRDPREYHEAHVRRHARKHVPEANRARVRCVLFPQSELTAMAHPTRPMMAL